MILVIDGYNVLKQALQKTRITDQERNEFISCLKRYSKQKNHTIITVFDGGLSTWPEKEITGSVTTIYSGANQTADEYIIYYIEANKSKELLLVSTDRALGQYAWNLEVESIDAADFYQLLTEATRPIENKTLAKNRVVKLTPQENTELDALMHEASKNTKPKKQDNSYEQQKKERPAKTRSKKERRMLKKIKKL